MIKREIYLNRIRPFYNDDLIKVITGVRRSGKSFLMNQIVDELLESNVKKEQIIFIDLDSKEYKGFKTGKQLEKEIDRLYTNEKEKTYLFIDEIQNIKDFEEIINAYRTSFNMSVFVTGSNSYLLSGELITKLTGRYIEFPILPFTYTEAIEYIEQLKSPIEFNIQNYIIYGGLPKRFEYQEKEQIYQYVESVTNQIIDKDILNRAKVKNKSLLKRMVDYVCVNPATTFSSASIVKYLKSESVNTKIHTINRYLDFIVNSKIANRCYRYDIKGKKVLKTEEKYYLSDLAFRTIRSNTNNISYSNTLENIVYNELISRGYRVYIGKLYNKEIDFIAMKENRIAYIQVSYLIGSDKAYEREFSALESIKDNHPKFVISMDPLDMSRDGIKHLKLVEDFLLDKKSIF
ncbi:MAG: ATP-binding protein [Erysipelotrichia bacterium]|jgi:predicted AAA+ superfamily ATPase|nr:ATP-binding protein [Erysipelotrichia bacterium]